MINIPLEVAVDVSIDSEVFVDTSLDEDIEMGLGVDISVGGGGVPYKGDYIVAPKPFSSTTLETRGRTLSDDVTVLEIPYFETSNVSGLTIYIGSEV